MTKPTIIFCPRDKAKALSEATGIHLLTFKAKREGLDILRNDGTIIVREGYSEGWRAPPNTHVEFVDGFGRNDADIIQAVGRLGFREEIPKSAFDYMRKHLTEDGKMNEWYRGHDSMEKRDEQHSSVPGKDSGGDAEVS